MLFIITVNIYAINLNGLAIDRARYTRCPNNSDASTYISNVTQSSMIFRNFFLFFLLYRCIYIAKKIAVYILFLFVI